MPTSRRNVGFALVGALLSVFLMPSSTSATPMITQESAMSPTASADKPDSLNMKGKEIFDYIFALTLFVLLMAFYIWYITRYEGCLSFDSFGVRDVADWLGNAYRLFKRTLSLLRLDTHLQSLAEARAVAGTDGTRPTSSTDGGDASPPTQTTPSQPPTANPQSEVVAATPDCATPSNHRHLSCVESA